MRSAYMSQDTMMTLNSVMSVIVHTDSATPLDLMSAGGVSGTFSGVYGNNTRREW